MGRSTGSELWAALGGLALGLAGSGALRWQPRHRRAREFLLPLGLNLAALAWLGAVLASGSEPGGMDRVWKGWIVPAGTTAVLGLLVFRFPKSVGLPVLALAAAGCWGVVTALQSFSAWGPSVRLPTVQPLTDRDTVTAFALRVDWIEPPVRLPLVPRTLYRFRTDPAPPPEWWWSWVASRGWARSEGAPIPARPLKFGVYRLSLVDGAPIWRLEKPELSPP